MKNIRNKYLSIFLTLALILPMLISPAFAASPSSDIDTEQPIGKSSIDFQAEDDRGDIPDDQVAWHFIFTGQGNQDKDSDATLTVTFESGITETVEVYKITGTATHFFVGTPTHDTIESVSLETTETSGKLVLSHVAHPIEEVLGMLTIEKVLLDVDDEAITEDDTEFTVNVEGPYKYNEDHTFSVDEPVVIEDLPLGDYTISEVHIPDGFELISIEEENITLSEKLQAVTVVVTNQVEEDIVIGEPGALIIEKLLLDADDEEITDDDTMFMVNIQGDEYDEDHEFSVNEPLVLDELEPGDYYITELSIPEGFEFVEISHEMVTLSENNEEDITVVVTNQAVEMLEDIEDEELPEGAPEEEIILDEEVPLGDGELPRTGQRHARDFYLLGLMISGLGVFMKRFYSRSSA